jgi:hypothetical protein
MLYVETIGVNESLLNNKESGSPKSDKGSEGSDRGNISLP